MLLCNTHIVKSVGVPLLERDQSGWPWHRSSDRHEARLGFGLFQNCFRKGLGVPTRDGLWWSGSRIENRGVMQILFFVLFRWGVTPTLLGEYMHNNRTLGREFHGIVKGLF